MKKIFVLIIALLLSPLAALHAAEPRCAHVASAYEAASHRVVFSTSAAGLNETTAATVQKTFSDKENVFALPKLKPGTTYFWWVDAVKADKSVVQGEVWTFITKATS